MICQETEEGTKSLFGHEIAMTAKTIITNEVAPKMIELTIFTEFVSVNQSEATITIEAG